MQEESVSIPSRRVGDGALSQLINVLALSFHPLKAGRRPVNSLPYLSLTAMFPSPQGGSETIQQRLLEGSRLYVSIPSRRVGDWRCPSPLAACILVSIPSRRVGDARDCLNGTGWICCFHPLKAGRRQEMQELVERMRNSFHPLKAGRRQSANRSRSKFVASFHPLKAGRRHNQGKFCLCRCFVSIPSRRVGDRW